MFSVQELAHMVVPNDAALFASGYSHSAMTCRAGMLFLRPTVLNAECDPLVLLDSLW